MKKKLAVLLAAAVGAACLGAGCGQVKSETQASKASQESKVHEPITIMDANRDYTGLIDLVHEKYPEINVEIIPYKGRNMTAYMKKQLKTGILPDIYCSSQIWDGELLKENLVDLSKYEVSDLYNQVRLRDVDVDGSVYLLPYDYSVIGITYNKSLLERNNIAVPTSFAQLREETVPALKEAGIDISACLMNLPGYPFQYFFNVSDTGFVNTLQGRQWQTAFVNGDVGAAEALQSSVALFQQWIDCGMVNLNMGSSENQAVLDRFLEGNTAFLFGTIQRFSRYEDGSGDQYGLMPYLSEDGSENIYATQSNRLYGLNKALEEPGNEQKLEDALHFLEVLSTNEGYNTLFGGISSTMCSIKEFTVQEDSPYWDAIQDINNGHAAPLIYNGWEDYVVPFGEAIRSWIEGSQTGAGAVAVLDDVRQQVKENGTTYYVNVTEKLNTVQAAQLSGQMFLEASGADAALISYNIYQPEVKSSQENGYGANGEILPGQMSEEDITIFLPTGWYDTLRTATLTGSKIKEMAKNGCDLRGNGYPYPYVLMTKDGKPLEDTAEYTVVICGIPKAEKDSLNLQDTGIVGLDAAKAYLQKLGELSSASLDDSLVQTVE